jgi:hypothetical protein
MTEQKICIEYVTGSGQVYFKAPPPEFVCKYSANQEKFITAGLCADSRTRDLRSTVDRNLQFSGFKT